MSSFIATPSRPYPTPCDPPQQPCPDCGGLECLCRPRFFAGQLLTDEDLNLLNHYILEKNKLHNRYLHGWGVVCGLEVICDPCAGVTVLPGYALSPCGEDIIVCKKQSVDVCSLISACKKPKNNCNPIDASPAGQNCQDTTEKWVLAIRYLEKPTRGIMSLKGASGSSCCSKCSCGGSSNCSCGGAATGCTQTSVSSSGGCGCGSGTTTSTRPRATAAPAQCEPTAICEGFTFEVCKLPANPPAPISPLIERMQCCLKLYVSNIQLIKDNANLQDLQQWCATIREELADLFAAYPGHACKLIASLGTLCQNAASGNVVALLEAAAVYLIQFLRDCICSALLPPCPAPVTDDRVFLATITVSRNDCSIIEICNWEQRKFAVGFPMLQYWLSPLQFGTNLKNLIARICCSPLVLREQVSGVSTEAALNVQNAQYPVNADQRTAAMSDIIAESFTRSLPLSVETLAMANLGAIGDNRQPLLSQSEAKMPMEALLMNQIVTPLIQNLAGVSGVGGLVTGARSESADVEALKEQIANMQSTIAQHTATIQDLNSRLEKK